VELIARVENVEHSNRISVLLEIMSENRKLKFKKVEKWIVSRSKF